VPEPFRIHVGDRAPVQQSAFTCGSAALTVARMLVDPIFARWVVEGDPSGHDLPAGDTPDRRVAAFEQVVVGRTNDLVGAGGRIQLPWPRRLGTPPWGARLELEAGAAEVGMRYEVSWCRLGSPLALRRHHAELSRRVGEGRPALLYVGSDFLPRHVTLVLPSQSGTGLDLYDPATGQVAPLPVHRFTGRRLGVAGWDVPWCTVLPSRC